MVTRFQQPQQTKHTQWVRSRFGSDDDDLFLPVSIYLSSSEERQEIIDSIGELLRAYGFTNIPGIYQAPGSFFIRIKAGFKSNDRHAARQSKEELRASLLKKQQPNSPQKRRAVKRFERSFHGRVRKKLGTIILAGALFLGGAFKDEIKDEVKTLIKEEIPAVLQSADAVVIKDFPPGVAAEFHKFVDWYIEHSPEKSELSLPLTDE